MKFGISIDSLRGPMARSAYPSPLKSAPASDRPIWSPDSAPSSMIPGLFWVQYCLCWRASPADDPYRTATAPACFWPLTIRCGMPMARSWYPSWLKSAPARARPNRSPWAACSPGMASESSVQNWLPGPAFTSRPFGPP